MDRICINDDLIKTDRDIQRKIRLKDQEERKTCQGWIIEACSRRRSMDMARRE